MRGDEDALNDPSPDVHHPEPHPVFRAMARCAPRQHPSKLFSEADMLDVVCQISDPLSPVGCVCPSDLLEWGATNLVRADLCARSSAHHLRS